MKLNSTVALTFVLLSMMFGAGLVSASWGIVLGREALKGITQPDTRPTNNLANRKGGSSSREGITILKEDEIINTVKTRVNGGGSSKPAPSPAPAAKPIVDNKSTGGTTLMTKFPLVAQSQGVVLELNSAQQEGDSLVLKVNLRNTGKSSVQFLYSFLSVKDEQGRELSANTDGLPSDLPASGEPYTGTITIPTAVMEKANKLSLSLTDYPDQKLQLQLSNIPITPAAVTQ